MPSLSFGNIRPILVLVAISNVLFVLFIDLNGFDNQRRQLSASSLRDGVVEKEAEEHRKIVDALANEYSKDVSKIWEFTPDDNLPIMNTFLQPLFGEIPEYGTLAIIAVWKHAWRQAGWNPRVLSLEDAKKHPDYQKVNDEIRHLSPRMEHDEYNAVCYLRYFAMAAVGGGYMSDYDTMPFHMPTSTYGELPNSGKFTSFQGFVPALLSGSKSEWEYVAKRLIVEGKKHPNDFFTDMLALRDAFYRGGKTEKDVVFDSKPQLPGYENFVSSVIPLLSDKLFETAPIDCSRLKKHVGIHISHAAADLKSGKMPGYEHFNQGVVLRPYIMAELMQRYHKDCGGPEFFASATKVLGGPDIFESAMTEREMNEEPTEVDLATLEKEGADHRNIVDAMAFEYSQDVSKIWEFTPDDNLPIMNTFFQPLHEEYPSLQEVSIIAIWKHAWRQAGWNPRVLSLEDAKKHPDYQKVNDEIRHLSPRMLKNEYEVMCYLRYFAMATVGGYMSDFDTVPLYFPTSEYGTLPNHGNLTSFAMHVPALLSGSKSEWEYVAKRLIVEGQKHTKETNQVLFSDMWALYDAFYGAGKTEKDHIFDVQAQQPSYENIPTSVIGSLPHALFNPKMKFDCHLMNKHVAIHVSHSSVGKKAGSLPGYEKADGNHQMRPYIMAEMLHKYHKNCGGPEFFASATREIIPMGIRVKRELKTQEKTPMDDLIIGDGTMQISREHKVMFVHVPRTGGEVIERSKLFDHPKKVANGGHFGIEDYHTREGINSEDFQSFGIVGHPCERFMDAFDYLKNGGSGNPVEVAWAKENIGDMTVDEYVLKGIPTYTHFQAMWPSMLMTDQSTGQSTMGVDNVFCEDQFKEVVDWVNEQFGPSMLGDEDIPAKAPSQCNSLNPETRKAIDDFYAMDYCIFGFDQVNTETEKCEARSISKEEYGDRMQQCFSQIPSMETKRRLQKEYHRHIF